MPNFLYYQKPRRRLPQDTTSLPPTPTGNVLRPNPVTVRTSHLLFARRRALLTLPREVPATRLVLPWAASKAIRDPRRLTAFIRPKGRNIRRVVPDTARFVLPLRVPRIRRTPPGFERFIPRPNAWSRGLIVHIGDLEAATPTIIGAGAPFLGGFLVTDVYWLSAMAIGLSFSTTYGTDYQYQLYAGRQLIGATVSTSERSIVGQLQPSTYPQWLTILAVEPAQRLTDYGDRLPPRPYNRVKLRWSTAGMPDDMRWIEITSGTVAGGAVSLSNILSLVPFDQNRFYEFLTPPLAGTGTWNFEIAHRDSRPPDGNRGTAAAIAASVVAIPPDVQLVVNSRLSVAIASQSATVTFTPP